MNGSTIKIGKYWLVLPILLAFAFTIALSLSYTHSVGVDIHFHLAIAEEYAKGNFLGAAETSLRVDKLIYPPLFHFMLVPSIWLNMAFPFTLILQAVFLPLAVLTFEYLAAKALGYEAAFVGGFLVLSSWAYSDRIIQVIPHSVSMILLPLALLFSMQNLNRRFLATSILMVWNHGLVALSALGGVLARKLWQREWRTIILFLLGCGFILALSFAYLPSALQGYGSGFCTNQEIAFWNRPATFFMNYVGLLTAGFAVILYRLIMWLRGVKPSSLSLISMATIASTAIMIPVWADRWVQFSTVPLALLILESYAGTKSYNRFAYASLIILYFVWTYSSYWLTLVAGAYQP